MFYESLLVKAEQVDTSNLNKEDGISVKLMKYYANIIIKHDKYQSYLMPMDYYEGPDMYFEVGVDSLSCQIYSPY